ncbi:hypothetical protein MD484_g8079, partial [Candolleomyces efflorescens]
MITDPSGVHQLRAPGPGTAKFMTNVGLDEVVNLTLQGPERVEAQQWEIVPVPASERPNMYYVYLHQSGGAKPLALVQQHRHGAHHHSKDHHMHDDCCLPQGPLILSARHVDEWEITPMVKLPEESTAKPFIFRPATNAPGREWCIGSDGSQVYIKSFSIDSTEERPYWLLEESTLAEALVTNA